MKDQDKTSSFTFGHRVNEVALMTKREVPTTIPFHQFAVTYRILRVYERYKNYRFLLNKKKRDCFTK